jgi:hypothetical protein
VAITTAMCSSFKKELMQGIHNFDSGSPSGDTFKLALIKSGMGSSYTAASTNYSDITSSPGDEVPNSGTYTAGGATLVNQGVTLSGTTAFTDFSDVSFTSATISADGCMIYNASEGNKAVSVHDFGGTKTSTNGTFSVIMPTADASNAILRLS